jgi:hypothetical protein
MGIQLLNKIINWALNPDGSVSVDDAGIIKAFTDDADFPHLVSFSRTGSHWLRMIMELYFEKPSLVRAFFFRGASDFTCFHAHDMELKLLRENVIYLYRNPVETVYSQLCYYKENPEDQERRQYWSNLYARHLAKWLVNDDFTLKKTVITYEGMKSDMHSEIQKICAHLGKKFDPVKLDFVLAQVSKEALKKKTKHDRQVVNLTVEYHTGRTEFANRYSEQIFSEINSHEPKLQCWLWE